MTAASLPFSFAAAIALASICPAQDRAAELLARLELEAKAGQLFMLWSLSRGEGQTTAATTTAPNHERLLAAVREAAVGGVILSLGSVDDAATLVPQLQAAAKVPLLLAGDFEGGVWFRLHGATELGNQMLVGAIGSTALAEQMGRVTGAEAKALGFHWVFAPVLDVNSNPANPIINVRSFGEDPELVARLGSAFARGVRQAGLLPCGKHFPGHGDVATDSHLALPTVPGDRERLRRVELRPFAAAIGDGLEAVMTGHLAVPGLGEAADVPATLSSRILTDLLRGELGFQGLIVTDALEMGGVKGALPPGEVAVRALAAGADVLLMPPDPLAARAAVVAAVREGRVPMARLDDAVLRILRAKQRVGLLGDGPLQNGGVAANWRQQVRSSEHEVIADAIAQRGLVLVREIDGALPLRPPAPKTRTVLLTLVDQDEGQGGAFAAGLGGLFEPKDHLRCAGTATEAEAIALVHSVRTAANVVLALHVKVREYQGGVGMPPVWQPLLAALREEQHVVAVSFGNPYLVQHLPQADAFVAAFASTPRVEAAAARLLRGLEGCSGRLPVTVVDVAAAGEGLSRLANGALQRPLLDVKPSEVDLAAELPQQLREVLQRAVADRVCPGAVCLVARRGVVAAHVAVGTLDYDAASPAVTRDTRYDLASLTKVCATTPAVLRLVAAGKLSLDDPVAKWLPAFVGDGKAAVTVRHLLAHQAGLPGYERYYRTLQGRDALVAAAAAEPLMHEPGSSVVYSDLGFVLLMAIVEQASGEAFATFVQREVLEPFGMRHAAFASTGAPPLEAAPTEHDAARGGVLRGHVHDENAFAMGGISGHAGLFAAADDVLRFGVAMLAGGGGVLPRSLVAEAIAPSGIGDDTTRGLGFQRSASGSWGGTDVPVGCFGHTGFTGTSLWCDPRHDLCVVLLTNRVHPTRVNGKIQALRRAVHDVVLGALR